MKIILSGKIVRFNVLSCSGERITIFEYNAHWRCQEVHQRRRGTNNQPQQAYPKRIKRKVSKHLFALIWNIYCMRYFFMVHRHSTYQFVKERIDYFNACKYFNFHHLNFQGMLTHLLPMNCLALILLVFSIYFRGCRFTGETCSCTA